MSQSHRIEAVPVDTADWTTLLPDTDHIRFFRNCSWSKTLLGPLNGWSLELRLYVIQALVDLRPACIYWGPHRVAIYNEPFTLLAAGTHPALMGARFQDIYPEIVDIICPMFVESESTRKTVPTGIVSLMVERNRFLEEAFFDGIFIPMICQDGTVGGFYNSVLEVTREQLSHRRSKMLNLISTPISSLSSTSVFSHISNCLSTNKVDIPLAALYMVTSESDDGNHELSLQYGSGLPPLLMNTLTASRLYDEAGITPILRAAGDQIVTTAFGRCNGINWDDTIWEGHGQAPQYLTTLPLLSAGRSYGFLVVGNNPRRPLDDQHHHFMSDLQRHVTSAITATIGMKEVLERSQRLQEQLVERERQIRYMAQHSDIGMMQLNLDGTLMWANEHYYSVVEREEKPVQRYTFVAEPHLSQEDHGPAKAAWLRVLQGQKVEAIELRLIKKYTPPFGDDVPTTILLSAFPYMVKGQIRSIMACMTEVSRLKWAESWQAQMALDAKEAKRQQSEFTDAISHEIRNPLSAILQLADGISRSLDSPPDPSISDCIARLEENTDAARSILDCAQHQKRIVDDVLTISKMDLTSISLVPIPTCPEDLTQKAVHILAADLAASSIKLRLVPKRPPNQAVCQQVSCDPLRISQILINLLSNAIKFTKHEPQRSITISYGVTESDPYIAFAPEVKWATRRGFQNGLVLDSPETEASKLYLTFSIQDSGLGMTSEQMSRVFDRFEQATPKTSIQYGGSGLGLFISHNLTEKHGGRIGAISHPGQGTTFVFFVRVGKIKTDQNSVQHEALASVSPALVAIDNAEVVREPLKWSKSIPSRRNPIHAYDFCLLLVEDNLINQKVLRKQLAKAGCTVHVANHGVEALSFLRDTSLWIENKGRGFHLDAILMDWEMPVMDGLTCTREIRSLESSGRFSRHPEIIAVTANVRREQVKIATDAGVDTVVPKPFVVAELLETIAIRINNS